METNKVYGMDCFEGMKLMADDSVDLIVTDPPYYIENLKEDLRGKTMRGDSENSVFYAEFDHFGSLGEFQSFMQKSLEEMQRVLKPKAQVYMFCSFHHLDWLIRMIKDLNFRYYKPLIWYKPDVNGLFPNQYGCNYEPVLWFRKRGDTGEVKNHIGCSQRDVLTFKTQNSSERAETGGHPTPKPLNLIRRLVLNGSNEGDLVFDPFMGSGTTALAAKQAGRAFLGFEKDLKYIPIIEARLSQKTFLNLIDWEVEAQDANT